MITEALKSLKPGAKWILRGSEYAGIEWLDTEQSKPTEAQIAAEVSRLENEKKYNAYQRMRAKEYPPITDYLDAVVKGDQAQIAKYIADCQAVKAKHPKP